MLTRTIFTKPGQQIQNSEEGINSVEPDLKDTDDIMIVRSRDFSKTP